MLSKILKELRKEKKMTQQEVANYLNMSRVGYARYEIGDRQPSYETLNLLSELFNVSIDYLLGNEENKKTPSNEGVRINVLGRVPAGIPLEAIEDIVDWEEIPAEWLKKGEYFALQLNGDSMAPKYLDKDIVIFKKQNTIDSNQEAIVYVNGYDATFKKVIIKDDCSITLQPLNPLHDPILVDKDETFTVLGVPVELRRKFY